MADNTQQPQTVLDSIIARAIEDAKDEAAREAISQTLGGIRDDSLLRDEIRARVRQLLDEDPEVKERMREAVLRALTAPSRRSY